jgi:putative sigma-54 modulation protein
MHIDFNFKNFEPSDHLKDFARSRFEKLEKYFRTSDNAYMQINLEVEKFRQIAEAILSVDDIHISAQEESEDMYSTIDLTLDKMEAQVRKYKDKQKDKRRGRSGKGLAQEVTGSGPAGDEEPLVIETEDMVPKPMDVDEAVNQLRTTDNDFLVFFNAELNRVNVIYRRKSGDYGLIDPRM